METEKKYFGGWVMWVLLLTVVCVIVLGGLRYIGIFGTTTVERMVFKNSYQYTEARNTEQVTYRAQLTEIERKLSDTTLTSTARANLESKASAIRVMLSTSQGR